MQLNLVILFAYLPANNRWYVVAHYGNVNMSSKRGKNDEACPAVMMLADVKRDMAINWLFITTDLIC